MHRWDKDFFYPTVYEWFLEKIYLMHRWDKYFCPTVYEWFLKQIYLMHRWDTDFFILPYMNDF